MNIRAKTTEQANRLIKAMSKYGGVLNNVQNIPPERYREHGFETITNLKPRFFNGMKRNEEVGPVIILFLICGKGVGFNKLSSSRLFKYV